MRTRILRNKRGFTLIELMIVMSIVGILASIAAPNFRWGLIKAKESVLKENLYSINSTINQFFADQGKYPESLKELVEKKYLPSIPKDPFTGKDDTWQSLQPTSLAPGETVSGVESVKSGSTLVSPTDGTAYNTW